MGREHDLGVRRVGQPLVVIGEPEGDLPHEENHREHGEKERCPERFTTPPSGGEDPKASGEREHRAVRSCDREEPEEEPRNENARCAGSCFLERREGERDRPGEQPRQKRLLEAPDGPDRDWRRERHRQASGETGKEPSSCLPRVRPNDCGDRRGSPEEAEHARRRHKADPELAEQGAAEHPEEIRVTLDPLAVVPRQAKPAQQSIRISERDEGVVRHEVAVVPGMGSQDRHRAREADEREPEGPRASRGSWTLGPGSWTRTGEITLSRGHFGVSPSSPASRRCSALQPGLLLGAEQRCGFSARPPQTAPRRALPAALLRARSTRGRDVTSAKPLLCRHAAASESAIASATFPSFQ